jgi:hypothetical protein
VVRDRHPQRLLFLHGVRERGVGRLNFDRHFSADELSRRVLQHRARQQARLDEDLHPVANAEDEAPAIGVRAHRAHDRRESRERSRTKRVTVAEAAGKDHHVRAIGERRVFVPNRHRFRADHVARDVHGVGVTI